MKKDKLFGMIHAIGRGKPLGYTNTSLSIASELSLSKPYAHRWLNHFCEVGFIARVRVAYKNTVKDYFCANNDDAIHAQMTFCEDMLSQTVLEVQSDGKWIQCLTTLNTQ